MVGVQQILISPALQSVRFLWISVVCDWAGAGHQHTTTSLSLEERNGWAPFWMYFLPLNLSFKCGFLINTRGAPRWNNLRTEWRWWQAGTVLSVFPVTLPKSVTERTELTDPVQSHWEGSGQREGYGSFISVLPGRQKASRFPQLYLKGCWQSMDLVSTYSSFSLCWPSALGPTKGSTQLLLPPSLALSFLICIAGSCAGLQQLSGSSWIRGHRGEMGGEAQHCVLPPARSCSSHYKMFVEHRKAGRPSPACLQSSHF